MLTKTDYLNFLSKHLSIFFRDITALGSAYFYGIVLLLVLALGESKLFWILFLGVALIMIISVLARLVYFKDRPNREAHRNILERIDASSFPSIHTGRIWFLSLALLDSFGSTAVKIFFILLAVIVSYSRIFLKKHDLVDLVGGFVLAVIMYLSFSFLF